MFSEKPVILESIFPCRWPTYNFFETIRLSASKRDFISCILLEWTLTFKDMMCCFSWRMVIVWCRWIFSRELLVYISLNCLMITVGCWLFTFSPFPSPLSISSSLNCFEELPPLGLVSFFESSFDSSMSFSSPLFPVVLFSINLSTDIFAKFESAETK